MLSWTETATEHMEDVLFTMTASKHTKVVYLEHFRVLKASPFLWENAIPPPRFIKIGTITFLPGFSRCVAGWCVHG